MIFLNFSVMDFNFQTEIKYIDSDTVSCSGDGLKESHPLIYLDLSSGKLQHAHIVVQNSKRRYEFGWKMN